jgi:hypothetical protein
MGVTHSYHGLSVPGTNNRGYFNWTFSKHAFGLCSLDPQLPRRFADLHKGRLNQVEAIRNADHDMLCHVTSPYSVITVIDKR